MQRRVGGIWSSQSVPRSGPPRPLMTRSAHQAGCARGCPRSPPRQVSVGVFTLARLDVGQNERAARLYFLRCSAPTDGNKSPPRPLRQLARRGCTLTQTAGREGTATREDNMKTEIAMQRVSRRTAFSLMGAAAALGLALPATLLTASDADAQTVGMDRRQDRRAGRRDRRDARRTGRQDRRDERRGTTTTTTGSGGTAPK